MSNVGRLAITAVAALVVGAWTYGGAVDHSGIVGTLTDSTAAGLAILALPVLTVAFVYRWWALSIALVPLAVLFYLHSATDYSYPYHEDPYPALTVFGTAILLAVASLGFPLRAVFDRVGPLKKPNG